MKKQLIDKTAEKIVSSMGLPLHYRAVRWKQKGNGIEEWSWHRSNLLSGNNRAPTTHTTRFSIKRHPDGNIHFGVFTTHAKQELRKFLQALAAGKSKSDKLISRLKSAGFEIEIYTAVSNSDDLLVIKNWADAKKMLAKVTSSKFAWYDSTFDSEVNSSIRSIKSWEAYLDNALPYLRQIFWMHLLGKNYWSVTSKIKVEPNRAHINTALRKKLKDLEGEKCQNILCRKRRTNVQVCHLDPTKDRELISNVVLLCGTCHNLQKPNDICKPKFTGDKNLFKVSFAKRGGGGVGHWMISSNHCLK